MAKKRTNRERPTLTKLRELRATIDTLQRQVSRSTALLTDIQATATDMRKRGINHGDRLSEAQGLLHSVLDKNQGHTILTNQIRRFLGRGGEVELTNEVERLIETHALANSELAGAN